MNAPLVQRLRFTHEHGLFIAANSGMDASCNEAANIIDELVSSLERILASGHAISSPLRADAEAAIAKAVQP